MGWSGKPKSKIRYYYIMSQEDRKKWDDRYAAGSHGGRVAASLFLQDWFSTYSDHISSGLTAQSGFEATSPEKPRALDVACGTGRNARYLVQEGFTVDAVDISPIGLERARDLSSDDLLDVRWIEADLDNYNFSLASYDLIILFRYKNIELMPKLVAALKPGGYFLCEQHLQSAAGVVGPTNPVFRWAPGELPDLVSSCALQIVSCFEGLVQDPDSKPAALARVVACKKWHAKNDM